MHFFSSAQFNNKTTWAACKRTQHCLSTTPNINWWMLYVASVCTPCWMLQRVVAQSLQRVKLFSQQLLTFLLFPDRQTIAQQCWIRLHSSSNIVGVTHTHYAWFTKTYGLYLSHDALQVPTLLGVVASVCSPFPTRNVRLHAALNRLYMKTDTRLFKGPIIYFIPPK